MSLCDFMYIADACEQRERDRDFLKYIQIDNDHLECHLGFFGPHYNANQFPLISELLTCSFIPDQ